MQFLISLCLCYTRPKSMPSWSNAM